MTDEEKAFLQSRRQSQGLVVSQAVADHAALRAVAIAKWEAAGGVYQSHPDIGDRQLREDVERVECSLSVLEDVLKDLHKWCEDLNLIQRTAIPLANLQRFVADLDRVSFNLDERVFIAFDRLDILSPAARQLSQEVDDRRKKRRAGAASEDVVAPSSGASTPLQSLAGACRCRKAPFCQFRCPCVRAGQECTTSCVCGDDCHSSLLD